VLLGSKMDRNEKAIFGLLGSLYEAAACPERWEDFLRLVAQTLACDKVLITIHNRQQNRAELQLGYGFDPEAIGQYNSYFGMRNPIVEHMFERVGKTGSWGGLRRALVDEGEYEQSEYYNDFGRKNGLYWAAYGAVRNSPYELSTLSAARSRTESPLGEEAVELIGTLLPHVKRVLKIHRTMESIRAKVHIALAGLDTVEAGVVAVDGAGTTVLTNRQADDILRAGDGICSFGGRLSATDPCASRKLESLVQSAAATGAGRGMNPGEAMFVQRRKGRPLRVSVVPFRSSHMLTEAAPCALVFINDPDLRPASRSSFLSALYHLTPAECRLADLFASGLTLSDAADRMRITCGTSRFMLKSIFSKTGTHRQSELMRLLLSLPGSAQA
jgi:DNA-binding CsgD family transcriptional regulator